MINVIVDAFGGDNAPDAVVEGSIMAVQNLGIKVTLVGNEKKIHEIAEKNNYSLVGLDVVHAETVIDVHEDPKSILKSRKDCSMAVGFQLLRDGKGDAFVSAGSTGALLMGATFIAKRLKGIKRAALSPLLPTETGYMILLDGGANIDCSPEALLQFAVMGSAYMEKVMNITSPRVGLLNIGTEDTKGRDLEKDTYKLLSEAPVNFVGNIEARELPFGKCDVLVTDGYSGNIALKLYEGMGLYFAGVLKGMLKKNVKTKIAASLLMGEVKDFKKKMDYSEVGGAVMLGIAGTVIKAHGSSDAKAFYNAIRQAKECVDGGITDQISLYLDSQKGGNDVD